MTTQWMMSADTAMEFFKRCQAKGAKTEEARVAILAELAAEGRMDSVIQTDRTPAQIVADKSKQFNVLYAKAVEATMDAVWTIDSETGEEVLIDRKTNQVIRRGRV